MRKALSLASKGRPHPNPPVGAVIVHNGRVIGSGWHDGPGTPHAEQMAIASCKQSPAGATLYVTLEPCCHMVGRDGASRIPCWQRCVDAGLVRVVIACEDVDPRTAGLGIQQLLDAEIAVDVGILESKAVYQQRGFRSLQATGRPHVIHKVATTLDGHTACEGGDSRWITGPEARRVVHRLRATCDAIIVGVSTVIADNPDLTARSVRLPSRRQPRVVVFDRTLRTPPDSRVARTGTVIVAMLGASEANAAALTKKGCHILMLDVDAYSVENILQRLADIGMGIVLVEAGGKLGGAFYRARCVDEVYWFVAPKMIGGETSPVGLAGPPLTTVMNKAIELTQMQMHRYGVDVLITGRPVWEGRGAEN